MSLHAVIPLPRRIAAWLPLLLVAAGALLLSGCKLIQLKMPGEPLSKHDHELRGRTREFAVEFAATVQQAADGIGASTTNARVQAAAVQWKIGAVGGMRRAALRPSPTLALVDEWAFCVQMREFLARGGETNFTGAAGDLALTNAQALERRIASIAASALGQSRAGEMREFVTNYAAAYPVKDLAFERAPLAALWEELSGAAPVVPTGNSADALADLSDRVQILGEQLPAEVRWRVGLQAAALEQPLAELRLATQRLDAGLTRIADVADGSPVMLSNAVAELRDGLVPMFGGLEKQWAATITALQQQRASLVVDFAREREAILKAVDEQRAAVIKDAERLAADVTDRSLSHLRGLVKDVMFYVVLLAVVVLGLPFVFGIIVGRASRRPAAP